MDVAKALICVRQRTDCQANETYSAFEVERMAHAEVAVRSSSHRKPEGHHMNISANAKPVLWGAAGGAVALAIVGFAWGGWMTSGKAEAAASMRIDSAVVEALAPVCVAKFRRDAAVDDNLAALKKVDSWSQGDFIEKGGWATVVDSTATAQMSSVAKACADILTKS